MQLLDPELFTSPLGIGDALFPDRCDAQRADVSPLASDATSALYVDVPGLTDLPCQYAPASRGRLAGTFQTQSETRDRVLLYLPPVGINDGMKLTLRVGGETRFLNIDDVVPFVGGAQIMLIVSPAE